MLRLTVDLHRNLRAVVVQCERIAEDVPDARLGALLLKRQRPGHRIAVADAEGGMAHPFGLADPHPDIARSVEQFIGSVYTEVHELHVATVWFRPSDMLQDIHGKLPAQIVVVPVAAKGKGDVEDTLVDKRLRIFHQVEDLFVAPLTEDTLHSRKVGAEQASELRYIDHLVVYDAVVDALFVEPEYKIVHCCCILLILYSTGVRRR